MSYCTYIESLPEGDKKRLHKDYHDTLYGFPITDDNELFGRLLLEINQAGLSWETILKKADAFRTAFDGFDVHKVSAYTGADVQRLLNNPQIIRNRLKIAAVIYNAQVICNMQVEFGSFSNWLNYHHPATKAEWVKLFKQNFRFTGGEIVGEFLMSIGLLPGAHDENCPVFLSNLQPQMYPTFKPK